MNHSNCLCELDCTKYTEMIQRKRTICSQIRFWSSTAPIVIHFDYMEKGGQDISLNEWVSM